LNQVCELAKTKFHLQRRLKVFFLLQRMWLFHYHCWVCKACAFWFQTQKRIKKKIPIWSIHCLMLKMGYMTFVAYASKSCNPFFLQVLNF
jgi:hypothetical protein